MQELEKILEEIDQEVKEYMEIDFGDEYNAGIKDMAKMSKKIIRKHMNDGWISCSERLPKEGGTYRVTVYDGRNTRISYMKWQNRLKTWNLTGRAAYWKVLAWQENPEPYKSQEESAEEKSMRDKEETFIGNNFLTKRFMEVR